MTSPRTNALSVELARLATDASCQRLTLGSVADRLPGKTPFLMSALFALPFCQPVPLLGLSTPLGLAIAMLALGAVFRDCVALPTRLSRVQIPAQFFPTLLNGTSRLVRWSERILHPRHQYLTRRPWRTAWACMMLIAAGLLMLPLPVPFSNAFPAVVILITSLGILEEDGLVTLLGLVAFAATLAFYSIIILAGTELWLLISDS